MMARIKMFAFLTNKQHELKLQILEELFKTKYRVLLYIMQREPMMLGLAGRATTLQGSFRTCQLLRLTHFSRLLVELGICQVCISLLDERIPHYTSHWDIMIPMITISKKSGTYEVFSFWWLFFPYSCLIFSRIGLLFSLYCVVFFYFFLINACLCHQVKCKLTGKGGNKWGRATMAYGLCLHQAWIRPNLFVQ